VPDPLQIKAICGCSCRQKLLKQLVTAVEDQGHDLCDQLCEQMCELLMQPKVGREVDARVGK